MISILKKIPIDFLAKNQMLASGDFKGYKIRKEAVLKFLEEYEGYDLTDMSEIRKLNKKI